MRRAPQLWAVLALAAALRGVGLAAFPEVVADEGLWTNSSKNYVRFGDWFLDGRKHVLLSPVAHALSALAFEAFGPRIAVARGINAVAGTLSVLLLYALVMRVAGRRDLAFASALLLAVTADVVFQSRLALIEPLQLLLLLAAALALAAGGARGALGGGLAFGLALLTKSNALAFAPLLPLFALAGRPVRDALHDPGFRGRIALFAIVALALAGAGYGALYAAEPERFVAAHGFELVGAHFDAEPWVRVGRFGIDPVQSARTAVALVRESPLLMSLCAFGLVFAGLQRDRAALPFAAWTLAGTAFFLLQTYQPMRYFHLVAPAYCFLAAIALAAWSPARMRAALAVYVAFNLAYLGMNAAANPATRVREVTRWAREHARPDDRIVAAGYFCTDLPQRAWAHYYLGADIEALAASFARLEIDYVIWDEGEWSPALRDELAVRYETVQVWSFGQVFRVTPAAP